MHFGIHLSYSRQRSMHAMVRRDVDDLFRQDATHVQIYNLCMKIVALFTRRPWLFYFQHLDDYS